MRSLLPKWLSYTAISLAALPMFGNTAQAAELYKGWNYAIDSPNDSLALRADNIRQAGGTVFEIGGIAFKDDVETDSVWFAISANLPLYGENTASQLCPLGDSRCYPVSDSNIGWGDLFLDFSGSENFKTASDNSQLYALRFAPRNDSRVPFLGVYGNVQATSVAWENAGYPTLFNNNSMLRRLTDNQRSASMGDLAWNDSYFASYVERAVNYDDRAAHMPNVIGSGNKIGEVTLLGREDLTKVGLDPGFFRANTSEIFGFRIPKALLPAGEFIATLLTECINDGVSLVSRLVATPPPPPPAAQICPVLEGQRNALLPTRIVNGVKIFEDVPSGVWYDPPANMGFQFVTNGDTLFTAINGFPCAITPPDAPENTKPAPFNVLVKNEQGLYELVGQYFPGQAGVNFQQLYGKGISEFIITGIDPDAWGPWLPENPSPLAFPLEFNKPKDQGVSFALRRIDDITKIPIAPIKLPGEPVPIVPGIPEIPDLIGPELRPPCISENGCTSTAIPEPSTIAGLVLVAGGWLRLRHRFKKNDPKD